jgi:hypothetical protein
MTDSFQKNIFLYKPHFQTNYLSKLLLQIIELHLSNKLDYNLHIITDSNLNKYMKNSYDDLKNINFNGLSLNYKNAILCSYFMYHYGGIWLNKNVLVLDNFDFYFDLIVTDKYKTVFYVDHNKKINKDFIATQSGLPFFKNWYNSLLNTNKVEEEINNDFNSNLIKDKDYLSNIICFDINKTIIPIAISDDSIIHEFLYKKLDETYNLDNNQSFIIIYNKIFDELSDHPTQNLFNQNNVLSYFLNKSLNNMTHLVNYDFIEIGTSNFDTLIEKASDSTIGLSVEPLNEYLDDLPNKNNVKKINAAVTYQKTNNTITIFHIPKNIIKKYNLPWWMKGCNSIGQPHPDILSSNARHLIKEKTVPLLNVNELFIKNKVKGIDFLKIDTEGHDHIILYGVYEWIKLLRKDFHPKKILFEHKHLKNVDIDKLIYLYGILNYKLISKSNNDITLELVCND